MCRHPGLAVHRPAGKPQSEAAAKQSVRAVLDKQVAAWNKGDLKEFMAGYWNSPDLSFFSGANKTKGWQATLERYHSGCATHGEILPDAVSTLATDERRLYQQAP